MTSGPGAGSRAVPAGWPSEVHPPGTDGWERTAVGWLLDLCPADYRGHPVLGRHVLALAFLASRHVAADLVGLREARAGIRTALSPWLEPAVVGQVFEVLDVEEARLLAARRGADLVARALRGERFVPRL